jgi:hypothetical protein
LQRKTGLLQLRLTEDGGFAPGATVADFGRGLRAGQELANSSKRTLQVAASRCASAVSRKQ